MSTSKMVALLVTLPSGEPCPQCKLVILTVNWDPAMEAELSNQTEGVPLTGSHTSSVEVPAREAGKSCVARLRPKAATEQAATSNRQNTRFLHDAIFDSPPRLNNGLQFRV